MEQQQRRKLYRWKLHRHTKLKLEGAESFCDCQVKDINLKGAQVSSPLRLPKDTFLKFCLFLAEDCVLEAEAWVVWHKLIAETNAYGLYFSKLKDGDKEKIYQFVQRNHPEQIKSQYRQEQYQEGGEDMPEAKFEDKRIFERFSVALPIKFLDLNSNQDGQGQTHDISAKGISLVAVRKLQPHAPLELWLNCQDKGEPLYTRGEVVWCSQVSPTEYRTGVCLEKANLMGLSRVLREA